jgi:hypothetical protein
MKLALNAHNSTPIYIFTIFDTETILKNYAKTEDPSAPTGLPHPGDPTFKTWVYMLTNWGDQLSGQATGNLEIHASVNDIVNWRSASLNNNAGESALISKITADTSGVITPPMVIISNPDEPYPPASYIGATNWPVGAYGPNSNVDLSPTKDFFWQSNVLNKGTTNYKIYFFIDTEKADPTDPNKTVPVRYFYWWDPKITVS